MPSASRHILRANEDALTQLEAEIRLMGDLTLENLRNAANGLLGRDVDLCNRAIADDSAVDLLEKKIDFMGMEIITRFSPVAADLRRVIASMKVSTALERSSDHAVGLGRRARHICGRPPVPETEGLRVLADLAANALRDSIGAFCDGNLPMALRLQGRNTSLDEALDAFTQRIITQLEIDSSQVESYVDLLFATRCLGRIGDQAINIAEDTIYFLTAQDIRHGGKLPEIS